MGNKVLILGWDCGAPDIVFNKLRGRLPAVEKIIAEGYKSKLRSCHPPITVPAWQVMLTGKDPGQLGLYGFRRRRGKSYTEFSFVSSRDISYPRIWEVIGRDGKKSILSGIPPSYPAYPVNGSLVSCFITPDNKSEYTYPRSLREEIENTIGEYPFDVVFRTADRIKLKEDIFKMTEKHFRVFKYLLNNKDWDFAMHVEIGLDRIHHGFWRYFDSSHHLYEAKSQFESVIPDYYKLLDRWLGRFMEKADKETLVIVASDHGAKAMKGAFCVNQWLEKEGYLVLEKKPIPGEKIQEAEVNWEKTKAWGWGGYYSRIFFNVKGREEKGIIGPENLDREIKILKEKIQKVTGPAGENWKTIVYTPGEIYLNPRGDSADLFVYWDNLSWRSAGTLGHQDIYLNQNDTGPDDGVHDWDGIFLAWQKGKNVEIEKQDLYIADVYNIALAHLQGKIKNSP